MKFKILIILTLLLSGLGNIWAFDQNDERQYVVIDKNGNKTDKIFRLHADDKQWYFEAKTALNTWESVACKKDCQLKELSTEKITALLGDNILETATTICMHNETFAFCRLSDATDQQRIYVIITLLTKQPAIIKLKPLMIQ